LQHREIETRALARKESFDDVRATESDAELVTGHTRLSDDELSRPHPEAVADPDVYAYADLMETCRRRNRRREHVFVASAGADGFAEARWLLEQRAAELVQGIVVWVPLERPDLADYLDRLREIDDGRIVGVRRSFEFEEPDFASRDEVVAGVEEVARRGLVCDIVIFHPALPAVIDLVRACPEATFVLDHLGKPPIRDGVTGLWREHIVELASLPNIVCKISGLMTEANHVLDAGQ